MLLCMLIYFFEWTINQQYSKRRCKTKNKIIAKDKMIIITQINEDDYFGLTDIAKTKNDVDTNMVIASWLRRVDTIEFLKLWELINNENFKPTDFKGVKSKQSQNAFTISPKKWIELTNAIGL